MGLTVTLNGETRSLDGFESGAPLEAVIAGLGLKADRVAVERNGEIVPRRQWGQATVADGDKLEVVHFVGGGSGSPGVPVLLAKRVDDRV